MCCRSHVTSGSRAADPIERPTVSHFWEWKHAGEQRPVCTIASSSASLATAQQPRYSSRVQRGPRCCLAYGLCSWQNIQPERTSRMKTIGRAGELPEFTRYTKYYEHDGLLRAYANRAMLFALIFAVLALASLGFAIYVRVHPPTVIRVDKDGNASIAGPARTEVVAALKLSDASLGVAPTDLEGRASVRRFLARYLSYTADSVDRNLAEALNMMTANLRVFTMNKLRDDDTVGKIKDEHIISDFDIRSIEHVKGTPWT